MDGSTLNSRYHIEGPIGHGAAAIVYRGRDLLLNRSVAIKILRAQYTGDPNYRARFQREAQAVASFAHPNIIDIYDVGEVGGAPYIVMEYVPGDTLKEIIRTEGPFAADDVAALIEQVAAALDYAHARGIVHRDVKPQNILVTREGLAKVVDFGIAKGPGDLSLTDAGMAIGSAHYLSPEQASGLPATPISDVYALGVIAYEMLAGRLPFDADTAVGVAMLHVNQAPTPPDEIDFEVPPPAADIVLRALEKDPTRRFPSCGAFAEALTHWRTGGIPPKGAMAHQAPVAPAAPPVIHAHAAPQPFAAPDVTQPIPTPRAYAAAPPDTAGWDDDVDADRVDPVYDARLERHRGAGGLWVGFLVVAALAVFIWIGGRVTGRFDGNATPPPVTPTIATEMVDIDALGLVGFSVDIAQQLLVNTGFPVAMIDEPSADVRAGDVIRVEPSGEVPLGTTVTLVVSVGDQVFIPGDLFGLPAATVARALEDEGLVVTGEVGASRAIIEGFGIDLAADNIENGDVVGVQDNGAQIGGWVPAGTSVSLVVYDETLGA